MEKMNWISDNLTPLLKRHLTRGVINEVKSRYKERYPESSQFPDYLRDSKEAQCLGDENTPHPLLAADIYEVCTVLDLPKPMYFVNWIEESICLDERYHIFDRKQCLSCWGRLYEDSYENEDADGDELRKREVQECRRCKMYTVIRPL